MLCAVAATAALAPHAALAAQSPADAAARRPTSLTTLGSQVDERARVAHLVDRTPTAGYLLRSASTLSPTRAPGPEHLSLRLVLPELHVVRNSALPYSLNDGALWAGKGSNVRISLGAEARWRNVRVLLVPEIVSSANDSFPFRDQPTRFYYPPPGPGRSAYATPYAVSPFSIDQPLRFGPTDYGRADPGQSSVTVTTGPAAWGFATENRWWGPGIRNAIVMSNNAPGVPHLFARTARPLRTRAGVFEGVWMLGGLDRSEYFVNAGAAEGDAFALAARESPVRSLSAAALTWQRDTTSNFTVGVSRAVYARVRGWGSVPGRALDVLAHVGNPRDRPADDSSQVPGRDQLSSLFARLVLPDDGFEAYAELARAELPTSARDFLVSPNHTLGYTYGLQWARAVATADRLLRLQAELTNVEKSPTFRDRPAGSFYASRRVLEGYTQRGQVIGASIGPGSSSQWAALDYVAPSWTVGLTASRIRWNQDAHDRIAWPEYAGWCEHDVSLLTGLRGGYSSAYGRVAAEVTNGRRLNAFFQSGPGCPFGPERRDPYNTTFSISVSPFAPPLGGRR